jgi:hypothetical protein
MSRPLVLLAVALCAVSLTEAGYKNSNVYDPNDPKADHTQWAIKLDEQGKQVEAMAAFENAAKFAPSVGTKLNVGVSRMRANRLDGVHLPPHHPTARSHSTRNPTGRDCHARGLQHGDELPGEGWR